MKLVVGPWLVDSSQNYITNIETNQVVKLEPRAMSVLVYFVKRPDQVISRDELIENIWNGRIVSDHAIYRVINQIRKAFDENDKDVYLTTLSKKGYKLVKPVSEFIEEQSEKILDSTVNSDIGVVVKSDDSSAKHTSIKIISEPIKYTVFFGLIALSLFVLWKSVLEAKWDYFQTELYTQIKPLNTSNFYEDYPGFSRDGKYLVYVSKNTENPSLNIFLKNMQSKTINQITSDSFDWVNPIASNDAKKIVAIKRNKKECKVVLFSKETDVYKRKELFNCAGNENLSFDINDLGTKIYYTYMDDINPLQRIFSYEIKNAKRVQLTNYVEQPALGDFKVALSPNNKMLAFLRSINKKQTYIGVINLNDNSEKIKIELNTWISSFGWDESGSALIYQDTTTRVNKYSTRYNYIKPVITGASNLNNSAKSTADRKLAIVQKEKAQYVFWKVFNPNVKNTGSNNRVERLHFSDSVEYFPKYANLSNKIAFMSIKSGNQQIWIREENGEVKQLTNFDDGRFIHHLEWSPNDEFIASSSYGDDKIYTVNTVSGDVLTVLKDIGYTDPGLPTWSSDGKSLYFSSNTDTDYDIYKVSILDSNVVKYTDFGVDWLMQLSDQVEIYIKTNEQGLWLRKNGEDEELIIQDVKIDNYQSISYRNESIYFYSHEANNLYIYSPQSKKLEKLILALNPKSITAHISVSADEKSIIFSEKLNEKSKIFIFNPTKK